MVCVGPELHRTLGVQAVEGLGRTGHEGCMEQGAFEAPGALHGWCLRRTGCKCPGCMGHAGSGEVCGAVSVYGAGVLWGLRCRRSRGTQGAPQGLRRTVSQVHRGWYLWGPIPGRDGRQGSWVTPASQHGMEVLGSPKGCERRRCTARCWFYQDHVARGGRWDRAPFLALPALGQGPGCWALGAGACRQ